MSLDFNPPSPCYLPDEFWLARPELRHIKQAAESRGRGRDALLGVVACRAMALVDYRWKIPPIVGSAASLNLLCGLVAPSGIGKSSINNMATELVPFPIELNISYGPNGSGEGLAATYVGMEGNKSDGELLRRSAMFYCDEGAGLVEIARRSGSTFASQLRTAAHGGPIGQTNGNKNTTRIVPAHQYRMVFVVGFQPSNAGPFIAQDAEGTPQRFVWATPYDPNHVQSPGDRPDWPGQLQLNAPKPSGDGYVRVAQTVRDDIQWGDYARQIGDTTESGSLDGHRDLERLRLANVLATLNGRCYEVTDEDYAMATQWSSASAALRDYTLKWWQTQQATEERTKASTRGVLADVTETSKRDAKVERVAKKIANSDHLPGTTEQKPWPITSAWLGRDSRGDTNIRHEAIEYGVERGWFKARGMAVYSCQ